MKASQCCDSCGAIVSHVKRCSRCRSAWYCGEACQRQHWNLHRTQCNAIALTLIVATQAVVSGADALFIQAASVQTRGAAGWTHFTIDEQDYLAVANFFTSAPGRQASMETESVIYRAGVVHPESSLLLEPHQSFKTTGAHGVAYMAHGGHHYLAVPNYYGGDSVVLRWDGKLQRFKELQRISSDGGGSIEAFLLDGQQMIGIAEFNIGITALYKLSGTYPDESFVPWQRLEAPGVGTMATSWVKDRAGQPQLLLLGSSYVTRRTGWRTRSPIFALNGALTAFERHHDVPTVGAHHVETINLDGKHFAFFSNDKDEQTVKQRSELFEWVGEYPDGSFVSRQIVATDGAHAACFFSTGDGRHFLAVANLGDRQANTYRRDSVVYAFDPLAPAGTDMLTVAQRLPTLGATDFHSFSMGGRTFIAVSNEQDDTRGGDVESKIWVVAQPSGQKGEL